MPIAVLKPSFIFNYLKMIRGLNLLIIGLTQYLTAIFLMGNKNGWQQYLFDKGFFLLVLSTVIIASAGYLINDYYDVKIDYVNRPDRVVIGKSLTRRWVIIGHVVLNFIGISFGFYLSPIIGVINFFAAFLLWLYSNQLKRLPFIGNLAIALLTGATLIVVGQYFREKEYLVLCYAIFAGFITLIREVVKDMQDLKGDEKFGCKTLPIVWGIPTTKKFIYWISFSFIGTVFFMVWPISKTLPIALLVTLIFLIFELSKADTVKAFGRISAYCKVIMLLGMVSMIFI